MLESYRKVWTLRITSSLLPYWFILKCYSIESDGGSNMDACSTSKSSPQESPDNTDLSGTTTPSQTPPPAPLSQDNVPTTSDSDSLFTVKAKLFYKKGSEFIEVGIGNLQVQDSSTKGSVHLLMRNDTSIGNIMLNVKVSGSMPLSRSKKSVLIVCPAPNPPFSIGEGPVTYLLRVKTDEIAEQLLNAIKDNIKD